MLQRHREIETAAPPGIRIRRRARDSAALRVLTRICPGDCFHFGAGDRVEMKAGGCTLCGICRQVCDATGEIVWGERHAPLA